MVKAPDEALPRNRGARSGRGWNRDRDGDETAARTGAPIEHVFEIVPHLSLARTGTIGAHCDPSVHRRLLRQVSVSTKNSFDFGPVRSFVSREVTKLQPADG